MLSIFSFIFGASIGSFVQVVASRLHVAPIMKGRSKCLSCGEALRVSDLVPVLSYLFLQGKCRYCKSRYGVSSLVVESIFGVTFLLLYKFILLGQPSLTVSLLWLTYYTVLFGVMGVMALYDKAHSYIPRSFLLAFLFLTGIMFVMRLGEDFSLSTLLSPLLVALPFFVLWLISRKKWLGLGDVLVFLGVGAFFGSLQGFAVLMIAVWCGAIVGLIVKYVFDTKKHQSLAIPFVPFIMIAFVIVLFTGIDVFSIATIFS